MTTAVVKVSEGVAERETDAEAVEDAVEDRLEVMVEAEEVEVLEGEGVGEATGATTEVERASD